MPGKEKKGKHFRQKPILWERRGAHTRGEGGKSDGKNFRSLLLFGRGEEWRDHLTRLLPLPPSPPVCSPPCFYSPSPLPPPPKGILDFFALQEWDLLKLGKVAMGQPAGRRGKKLHHSRSLLPLSPPALLQILTPGRTCCYGGRTVNPTAFVRREFFPPEIGILRSSLIFYVIYRPRRA